MATKDITSVRDLLEFLKERGELLTVKGEVDPIYEISGIQKALDNGPALLFENTKGYPGVRCLGNVFSREERTAAMFGVDDYRKFKFKCLEAIKNPLPPRVVDGGPCQEVVITKDIDLLATLPVLKHSEDDAGRILGGGIIPTLPPYVPSGSDLCYKRMHIRGKDWFSICILRATHLGYSTYLDHPQEKQPMAISISPSPAVMVVASTLTIHSIIPYGSDELGIAGALQGSPVELCHAKTVDAYAIANSEWVIEGYRLPERVWETDEAEKLGKGRAAPFFPEWTGHLGKATRGFKFQVTAITHRKDRPIFDTPLAHSINVENMSIPLREACFYELAQRIVPRLVVDVNVLHGFKQSAGVVFQVRKRSSADDGFVKNLLQSTLGVSLARIVVAVDDDVNIYNADEVFWAITTRTNPETGIVKSPQGSLGVGLIPSEDVSRAGGAGTGGGGIAFDATAPYTLKGQFKRAHYPADRIELKKWFSEAQIASIQAQQSDYARHLGKIGG